MSAEKLKALVEKGNLINLNIVSDSLANLLNEVANMLVEQQKQIVELKKEIGEKCSQTEFDSFKSQWIADRDTIMRSFPSIEDKIAQVNNDLKTQNEETKEFVENSISNVLISVDNRILQKTDLIASNQQYLTHSLSELEEKVNSYQKSNTSSLASGRSGRNPPQYDEMDIQDRLQKLEDQVSQIINKDTESSQGQITDRSLSANLESSEKDPNSGTEPTQKIQIDENTLEVLRAEIKDQLQQMQEQIESTSKEQNDQENPNDEANQDFLGQGDFAGNEQDGYNEFEQMKVEIGQIEEAIEEQNKNLISRIERKMEILLVERMFEKLRLIITSTKDEIAALERKIDAFVEKKQMEEYVQGTIRNLLEDEHASFTNKPIRCLACGRPKLNASNLEIMPTTTQASTKDRNSELPVLKFTIPRL